LVVPWVVASLIAGCAPRVAPDQRGIDFGALLEPPAGRVLHGWGQISGYWTWDDPASARDLDDLDAYVKAASPLAPAMISFYLAPVESQVAGFLRKYKVFVESHPFFVTQIGFYFLDDFLQKQVASGEADTQMRILFEGLRDAGRPVLLRAGHEFNNHWSPYDPALYVKGFRRVADLARRVAPKTIATVWHAEPTGFADRNYLDWYPGDEYVDWWGLSLFYQEHMTDKRTVQFMNDAARHRKPVLIGECSPWFHGAESGTVRGPRGVEEAKGWYDKLFGFVRAYPHVKAVSVIVVDWTRWNPHFRQIPGGLPNVRFDSMPGLADFYGKLIGSEAFVHSEEASRLYGSPR
jgi:hypothetical protein